MTASGDAVDIDDLILKIQKDSIDLVTRAGYADQLLRSIDSWKEQDTSRFINTGLLPIITTLRDLTPSFQRDAPEQKLRHSLIGVLTRTPLAEGIKQQASTVTDLLFQIIKSDNEDNGLLAVKMFIDMSRSFLASEERHVAVFAEIVGTIYQNMESLNEATFMEEALPQKDDEGEKIVIRHSLRSFKVLTECPVATVLIFQAYRSISNPSIRTMLPAVVAFLRLQAPQQKQCHETARLNNTFWSGVAPALQNNQYFRDLVTAQVKTMSFLAFILRGANEPLLQYIDIIPGAGVRLLQDCPPDMPNLRKELLVATRHILSTDFRQSFISHVELILEERVLLGSDIASQETLRPSSYSMLADMIHHVRSELNARQLVSVIKTYTGMVHNTALPGAVQTMCAKLLMTLTESVIAKDTREGATEVLRGLLSSGIERLASLHLTHADLGDLRQELSGGTSYAALERAKPIFGAAFVSEPFEDVLKEFRQLFRTLLYGVRAVLAGLRQIEAIPPDAETLGHFFRSAVACLALFRDRDARDEREVMDLFASIWQEVNPHVFQEVWTSNMEYFVGEASSHVTLTNIAQWLFDSDKRSRQLVSISLRHFTDRLDTLGDLDTKSAAVFIRFTRLAFGAVAQFPDLNEASLAPHLSKLIMDSFPMAAKSLEPSNYFLLLKGLFRAIGGGQGRFELLYKEVLPLLPEMLESLNKMLLSAEPNSVKRDLLIELNLTVPVRLAHLLKFLHYLMTPLVYALEGGPELVTQGLRTLELMVDNLTPEFLDPTIQPVLRELMSALSKHLKPIPAAIHQHSHTIIRTLGKLGGRNRRLLERQPNLAYRSPSERAMLAITFNDRPIALDLNLIVHLGTKALRHRDGQIRDNGFKTLKYAISAVLTLMRRGPMGPSGEEAYAAVLGGLFEASHLSEFAVEALALVQSILRQVFTLESLRPVAASSSRRPPTSPLNIFLMNVPNVLLCKLPDELDGARDFVLVLIRDMISLGQEERADAVREKDVAAILHRLAACFTTLCYESSWKQKTAGFTGLAIMTGAIDLGARWNLEREIDVVRALLFVLKDMPRDAPRNAQDVLPILVRVIRACNRSGLHAESQEAIMAAAKLGLLITVLIQELPSPHISVREAAKLCIATLAEIYGKTTHDLLAPHRDRFLGTVFSKPLRALPIQAQIGNIDAMTYALSLDPPLPDASDELLRLLQEAIGSADADDSNLVSRPMYRQNVSAITNLRVACIKLLTASMPVTDLFVKQPTTRQKLTGLYFKSLYSSSPEVKKVAHDGLRIVLSIQSRLPRDLLQTGLRPILMNLADPKRLSVPGLEGLARLLELLTSYFKVEIGTKLLDHIRIIAEPIARESAYTPLSDNDEIRKLVKLVNIFHLLPHSADVFLKDLVTCVVRVEGDLHMASPGPFTQPIAKFLNRYPFEAVQYFQDRFADRLHIRTLRNVLQSREAPLFEKALLGQIQFLYDNCCGSSKELIHSALLIINELSIIYPYWLNDHPRLLSAIIKLWRANAYKCEDSSDPHIPKQLSITVKIFCELIRDSPRLDILFEVTSLFSLNVTAAVSNLSRFLYAHVITNPSSAYRRNVIFRFLLWFEDDKIEPKQKALFLRNVLTPMLYYAGESRDPQKDFIDAEVIRWLHSRVWKPWAENSLQSAKNGFLCIELLNFCSVIVRYYSPYVEDNRKDIIKSTWNCVNSDDVAVKQCAYLLATRFFEAFDSPPKFIMTALTGLLRPGQSENRMLTKQAVDILIPVLPRRLPPGSEGAPQWAKLIRKILIEDGHGQAQLVVIYQLLVRHRSIFYPWRELFVPHMVHSLGRLGVSSSTTIESRLLSLDMIETIWVWEQKFLQGMPSPQNDSAMEVDVADHPEPQSQWSMPQAFREAIVSYIVRAVVSHVDTTQRASIVNRSVALLNEMLSSDAWGDVQVKLAFFTKYFEQPEKEGSSGHIHNSLRVLATVAKNKPDDWFLDNAETLQDILQKAVASDDVSILEMMQPTIERLLRVFPLPKQDDDSQADSAIPFHGYVSNAIAEGLRTGTNLKGSLLLLNIVVQINPDRVDQFSPGLMKLLAKFMKEHCSSAPNAASHEGAVRFLCSILDICSHVVGVLGDQRKVLLSSIIQLMEKSASLELCQLILGIVRDWILGRREMFPTLKEKAALVAKMQCFERLGESLFKDFLTLVYDIYSEPSLRRTDLTVRLESSFLLGCRAQDTSVRELFIELLNNSIPRGVVARLSYVIGIQSWEPLADHHWLYLALDLIFSSADLDNVQVSDTGDTSSTVAVMIDGDASSSAQIADLLKPVRRLLFTDPGIAHDMWVTVFPSLWSSLSRKEQTELNHHLLILLTKEYHVKQATLRPNVIQTLLCGISACSPAITLPPHLVKFLGRTFGAWHVAMEILQNSLDQGKDEEQSSDITQDALVELYAELAEEDMFYGLWRRRTLYPEANAALSFEQNGMWLQAQSLYEAAQSRSRNGTQPFSEVEYDLWEDHWVLAAQKMQQWDVLIELAKNEGNHDLFLESAWRLMDWHSEINVIEEHLTAVNDIQTPRRRIFEGLIALTKGAGTSFDKNGTDLTRIIDDAMQLSLRKWASLPEVVSIAHVPLLQHFQQVLELQEAAQIFASVSSTTAQSLEKKSSEMKHILQAWRERLPNLGDDIGIWSDLIAWRQHVFSAINRFFVPFIQAPQGAAANNSNTVGYRGYHETAWIINRFAHVARKHHLMDVCNHSLNKIYTLPNIEISEAFLKLREQARCHYQNPSELQMGLEVINNTNLMYFSNPQKAEFYTLKAMFFSKLGSKEDANRAFATAVQMDMTLPKAWAEWGKYGDRSFQESPADLTSAASAVSCYLQAAGLYRSAKSRPLLVRVLWLLSVDDGTMIVSRAFDTYKGEAALWYWITLVPQLLLSLSHREAKHARYILMSLAKLFPQALFFHLRTTKEEMVALKRAAFNRQQQKLAQSSISKSGEGVAEIRPSTQQAIDSATPAGLKQPFDYIEEIVSILKTAFPLLALTMETFVDQINSRFKATPDEDTFRFTSILVTEAISAYTQRVHSGIEDGTVPPTCTSNALRFAANVMGNVRGEFEDDVIKSKPSLRQHIRKLQKWRDRYERILDARPRFQPLDLLSHWLVEFQHGKWDDIEVPGQYLEHKDNNSNFVKISRLAPKFEVCRAHGYSFRRLTLHGHDGTTHTFAVQLPSARHGRREERLVQLFRIFNGVLARRKETRKRNISFHLPAAVPFNPSLRLLENDASYITMQDIYDQRCEEIGISREDPILLFGDKGKTVTEPGRADSTNLRLEVMSELMAKTVPTNTLSKYMIKTMETPSDLWAMRKQFALQISSATFMTYVMCLSARYPSRFHISRKTGLVHVSEMLPSLSSQQPVFANPEAVPFRLTPNMQHFMTPVGIEGLLTVGLISIGRSLTGPEFEMDQQLSLFLRDEVLTWYNIHQQSPQVDAGFREQVAGMVDGVVKRAENVACKVDREKEWKPSNSLSAVQTISNLISTATNPIALSKMSENYHAFF